MAARKRKQRAAVGISWAEYRKLYGIPEPPPKPPKPKREPPERDEFGRFKKKRKKRKGGVGPLPPVVSPTRGGPFRTLINTPDEVFVAFWELYARSTISDKSPTVVCLTDKGTFAVPKGVIDNRNDFADWCDDNGIEDCEIEVVGVYVGE